MVLQLKPADTGGTLDASIQWGEEEGPDPMLVHGITIPLGPVRLGGQADDEPVLRLRFDPLRRAQLAGTGRPQFHFPERGPRDRGRGKRTRSTTSTAACGWATTTTGSSSAVSPSAGTTAPG